MKSPSTKRSGTSRSQEARHRRPKTPATPQSQSLFPSEARVALQASGIQILFENSQLFALSKPALLHSVALQKGGGTSVAFHLLAALPALSDVSEQPSDAGLVNRLDFETSGVLIGAKSRRAWEDLRKAWSARRVKKSYIVLLEGTIHRRHSIAAPIGTPYRGAKKVRVYPEMPSAKHRAQEAESFLEPLTQDSKNGVTLALVHTHTGCRHQVRAHMGYIKVPLLGDTLYGSNRTLSELTGGEEGAYPPFFLHAWRVCFENLKLTVTAPIERALPESSILSTMLSKAGLSDS